MEDGGWRAEGKVRGIPETHPTDEEAESWQEDEWEKELMH
jgi:hypothetical protein